MYKFRLLAAGLMAAGALTAVAEDSEVLATRGKAEITHLEFDARMAEIPAKDHAGFLRDGKRLESLVANLLLREQLAADAREAGFDQDSLVEARLALAAQNKLAEIWLEHYIDAQGEADFEALAREYYMLHPHEYMTEMKVDVSHILVSQETRPQDEARALAESIREELRASPESFDDLIIEYSEDSSVAENRGHFTGVSRGDMVKPFEEAAFSQPPGEISEPVLSAYGYHLIRVDKVHKARVKTFDEVRPIVEQQERKRHRDRIRHDYLNQLANQDVNMKEEALKDMLSRYFKPEALADWETTDSE